MQAQKPLVLRLPFQNIRPDGVFRYKGCDAEFFHLTRPGRPPLKENIHILRQWIHRNKALFRPKIKNYTDYFPIERRLIFTVGRARDSGELIGFSGVYNGGRFPKGVWRVFDRTWTSPRFRVHGILPSFHSDRIFPLHFALLKEAGMLTDNSRRRSLSQQQKQTFAASGANAADPERSANILFFCRETNCEGKALQIFLQKLSFVTKTEWRAAPEDRFYQVAPGKRRSCFQRLCFTLLNKEKGGFDSFPLPFLREKEHADLIF